ncbi:MAG: hypothetical protein OEX18_15790 [Candidatus Krumholzibacteria bacterium]|nr:hypothetical protein [Candidatus Krumholzibacteria bacterium]MDH4338724.1 hypothetical protein [Candidatus Krumholzibacteria bacterium]MDH5270737.1 hypothetical protein [Candidatus Krumholzibacteria bacterium]MDH5627072.1 hypothetical protein [Candidatus Krumholzibacteria bacterium]
MKRSLVFVFVAVVFAASLADVPSAPARFSIPDPCQSTATSAAGMHFICPAGDGDVLGDAGLTITVTVVVDQTPVPNIPPEDFWLIGCNDLISLCGGANSINATAPTDENGMTTITGTLAGSGCDAGVRVVVQGIVLGNGACAPICLPIATRSPDQKNPAGGPPDLLVSSADFAFFGTSYESPPKPYFACHDFAIPYGTITLADFARFGAHYGHSC